MKKKKSTTDPDKRHVSFYLNIILPTSYVLKYIFITIIDTLLFTRFVL